MLLIPKVSILSEQIRQNHIQNVITILVYKTINIFFMAAIGVYSL